MTLCEFRLIRYYFLSVIQYQVFEIVSPLDTQITLLKPALEEMNAVKPKPVLPQEEQQARAKERMERIQAYTSKLKSSTGISDLEKEPAYKRKNIQIDELPHSSEESMSKFTLSGDGESGGLKDNNSFLHDNVD